MSKRKLNEVESDRNNNEESAVNSAKVLKTMITGALSPPASQSGEEDVKSLEDALNFIKQMFPYHLFQKHLPAIIWKHQLYALISDRTSVDKELNQMIERGVLRSFAMGSTMGKHELAICFAEEYKNLTDKIMTGPLFLKFWSILDSDFDCSFSKDDLVGKYGLNESNIKELVHLGVLSLHRSVGFYILSVPSCGDYSKRFEDGRKAVLNIIKKSKFKEISKLNLINRKLPHEVKLPILYHILDLIGSDRVQCIRSPTGLILRCK